MEYDIKCVFYYIYLYRTIRRARSRLFFYFVGNSHSDSSGFQICSMTIFCLVFKYLLRLVVLYQEYPVVVDTDLGFSNEYSFIYNKLLGIDDFLKTLMYLNHNLNV